MQANSPSSVLILGANGRFGRVAVEAFSRAGWHVIAQSRSAPSEALPRNAVPLVCEALDTDRIHGACTGKIQVIVNALNPAYTKWEQLVPPITASVLALARETGAMIMLPGNVYNFGSALPEVLSEHTSSVPNTSKARVRIELERQMQLAAAEGVRSVVIRAGDFLGGAGPGTWMDMVMAKKLNKQQFTYLGPTDVEHAWAYLPDLARVFVAVGEHRNALPPFEVLHYGGLACTGRELFHAMERVTGRALQLKQMPWWLLRLLSPVVPMCKAVLEMRYLWLRPHRLDETKLASLIGEVPHTSLDQVLRHCIAPNSMGGEENIGQAIESHAIHK
ncbi:NAD-dependent epimerase/dehydratase family protein [Noviherbaspirillum saxi]|nr:NAD-dependent epimerase/dehydratase family protein [Noviherbaspirillum saxi]